LEDYLKDLETHVAMCDSRFERIEKRLDSYKISLNSLDGKLWGLAVLIMIAPFVQKLLV
jgi:hypothetical protein